MNEEIEQLVKKAWPMIVDKLNRGMDPNAEWNKPALNGCLFVETLEDPALHRVSSLAWREAPLGAPLAGRPQIEVKKFNPGFECAYELSFSEPLMAEDLRADEGLVLRNCFRFAQGIRQRELMVALGLFCTKAEPRESAYDIASLQEKASEISGLCRLLVRSETAVSEEALRTGIVDSVVNVGPALPPEVQALLVKMGGGPTFQRIVDDLTPVWRRSEGASIQLILCERFFLHVPDGTAIKILSTIGVEAQPATAGKRIATSRHASKRSQ